MAVSGRPWGGLGAVWGGLGVVLGLSWVDLGRSLGCVGAVCLFAGLGFIFVREKGPGSSQGKRRETKRSKNEQK